MKVDNYMKAYENQIMWWPTNQECVGCIHSKKMYFQDLQDLGMFPDVISIDEERISIHPDDACLAFHANKCERNIVLGTLGTDEYECPSVEYGE